MSHQHPARVAAATGRRRSATVAGIGVAFAGGILLTGCGEAAIAGPGPTTTEERPVEGAHAVELRTSGDLTIRSGTTPRLTITAGRTNLRYLTASVQDGTVVLGSRAGRSVNGAIHYELTLPTVDSVVIAGSGNAIGTVVSVGSFGVNVSGSGSVDVDGLSATEVTVEVSGSGDVHLAGTTVAQSVELAGSGSYVGTGLSSRASDVQVDGSGSARVNATQRLSAGISGSGNITYVGKPALTQRVSGSGTISAG